MNRNSIEASINLLTTMVIQGRAKRENRGFVEVFREFRRSVTFQDLYDPESGLWLNGPDYISDEYDMELGRTLGPVSK